MDHQLTQELTHLLSVYEEETAKKKEKKSEPMIQVNEVIGYLAFIYEKTRNVVEFSEEHVLRKNTIRRILRRKLIETRDTNEVAAGLLRELVRYRHLENNAVPESRINDVARPITRYKAAREMIGNAGMSSEEARALRRFLIEVTVTEIDDMIVSKNIEYAFVNFGFNILNPMITLGGGVDENFKSVQVFMALLKSFVKLDDEMIVYHLMGVIFPDWFTLHDRLPGDIVQHLIKTKAAVDAHLQFPLRRKVLATVTKYSPYFNILRDSLLNDPKKFKELVENPDPEQSDPFKKRPESLHDYLGNIIENRYAHIRSRLLTRSIRAFIYVLITKVVIAFLVEVPADLFLQGHINFLTLGINIIFPLVLILLMTLTVRIPGKDNTEKLIAGIRDLIYTDADSDVFAEEKVVEVKQNGLANAVFMGLYALLSAAIYGVIIYWLIRFEFNIVSGFIFLLLTSVMSYFAVLIRQPVKQIRVVKTRENIFSFLINLLSLPILQVGRFLSENVSKINVFVYILDLLIEAPFQILIQVFEEWVEYLRGKREEIY